MKYLSLLLILLSAVTFTIAQDITILLKDAETFDKQLKEKEAKEKYTEILSIDAVNAKALLRLTELNCAEGARIADKKLRIPYFNAAMQYAQKMYEAYPENADASYVMALVNLMIADTRGDTKDVVNNLKLSHEYATKAITADSNNAKSYYLLGKWNYDLLGMSWYKKTIIKTLYEKVPAANIDSAINYFEKARSIMPYFVADYFLLAKAYQLKNRPAKTIEVLNVLVKLPNRTADDAAMKEEAKKILEGEQ